MERRGPHVPQLESCCWCASLQTGTIIIACLDLVICLLWLVDGIGEHLGLIPFGEGPETGFPWYEEIAGAGGALVALLLLYGVYDWQAWPVLLWVLYRVIVMLFDLAWQVDRTVQVFIGNEDLADFLVYFFFFLFLDLLYVYFILVVYSYYRSMEY